MKELSTEFAVSEEYRQILLGIYTRLLQTRLWGKVCSSCFCMAGFLCMAFTDMGRIAEVLPCYAVASKGEENFLYGYKDIVSAPSQVDGHVVCLVDETIIVDFGLLNLQRYGWPDFPGAVAFEVDFDNIFPCGLIFDKQRKIIWSNDWVNPASHEILATHKPVIKKLFKQYKAVPAKMRPCPY